MYQILIHHEDDEPDAAPACLFPTSTNKKAAEVVWQFMVDNLKLGWRMSLLDVEGDMVQEAMAGDTKKLPPRWIE